MKKCIPNHIQVNLDPGITRAGSGQDDVVWNILGHTYWLKSSAQNVFAFETLDPPGTYVPVHTHPTQDEFILVKEGTFDLYLDGEHHRAGPGDLVRMPMGIPHGYYNLGDTPARAMFWVSPSRRLHELFDNLHNLGDPAEVVRLSALCEVNFMRPEDYKFDPLAMKK